MFKHRQNRQGDAESFFHGRDQPDCGEGGSAHIEKIILGTKFSGSQNIFPYLC